MKGGKRINKERPKLTRHHIIPVSKGGTDEPDNVVMIHQKQHEAYHTLFGNMTPVEIMHYLNVAFWKGNFTFRLEREVNED